MSREEFMKKLAYLLSDISEEEREDALLYYEDYFDEAGEEKEQEVIRELGSPERVASIIRHSAQGISDGGSFTEIGFEDERFRDPNFELAKRLDLPEVVEKKETAETKDVERKENEESAEDNPFAAFEKHDGFFFEEASKEPAGDEFEARRKSTKEERRRKGRKSDERSGKPWTNPWLKLVLLLILIGRAWDMLEVIFDLGIGVVGILVSCLLLAGTAVIFFLVMMVIFFALAAWNVLNPVTLMFYGGLGLASLGLMCLCLVLAVKVYGSWLPSLVKKLYRFCHKIWEGLWSGRRVEK